MGSHCWPRPIMWAHLLQGRLTGQFVSVPGRGGGSLHTGSIPGAYSPSLPLSQASRWLGCKLGRIKCLGEVTGDSKWAGTSTQELWGSVLEHHPLSSASWPWGSCCKRVRWETGEVGGGPLKFGLGIISGRIENPPLNSHSVQAQQC